MRRIRSANAVLNIPTLKLEGGLFLPDQLEKAALGRAEWQSETDYRTPKGLTLKDDYSRSFQIAIAQWKQFSASWERSDLDRDQISREFLLELLRDAFGYLNIKVVNGVTHDDRTYPVSLLAQDLPIIAAPHYIGLDDSDARFAITGAGSRKKSPFQAAQELVNASPRYQWAIVSNGKQIRLLRDAATLTRPSYLEFDLEDLLTASRFSEFANAWRLLHSSRADTTITGDKAKNVWEAWREAGQEEGTRVRDGLRFGVTQALITLGNGFLKHAGNEELRKQLFDGRLDADAYFQQLLRLIYRFLFLFSVEERGVLHTTGESAESISARKAYAVGYSLGRLKELSLKRRARNHHTDHWQALVIVFKALAKGEPRLALPALGGLFATEQCPALDSCALDNAHLLSAMQHLRWANHNGTLAPVDYRNMGPEELGSVYESLLELVPVVELSSKEFGFVGITSEGSTAGNSRKLTGSYYTPDVLVQELIKSALEPVIAQKLANNPENPVEAILSLRVVDPACGSGHFLLAAARRIAETLAHLRAPDGAVKPQDYRHALREVIGKCIYGVDRNPMALELARTALWLEGFEEGRPLTFLDHHLRCGDALLGLMDLKSIQSGIPKDAFKALSGDDKPVCKELARKNAAGLKRLERDLKTTQFTLRFDQVPGIETLNAIEKMPADTTVEVEQKEFEYKKFLEEAQNSRIAQAADIVVGAFLITKRAENQERTPTNELLHRLLMGDTFKRDGEEKSRQQIGTAREVCSKARVFHWPLQFPQVFGAGGFDCVLGNPPWERIKLQEEEFFATRSQHVAEAKNKAERMARIQLLAQGSLARELLPDLKGAEDGSIAEQRLYNEFLLARRTAEASSVFAHVDGKDGGRFPLTGVGDVNTYALFSETISQIVHSQGRAGFIVPTGIATDDSTKQFFGYISQNQKLVSLFDIENRDGLFPAVDSRVKFCLVTLGSAPQAEFLCFLTQVSQISDSRRRFRLSPEEFQLINPNTLTCPMFRSERDAELTKKIYRSAPVLIEEGKDDGNPWGISFAAMFHMSGDSDLFFDLPSSERVPLYEAKLAHQFDHRWATYTAAGDSRDVTLEETQDQNFTVNPRYWVSRQEVEERLRAKGWDRGWLLGWRDICRATDERTVISSVVPRVGVGNQFPLILFSNTKEYRLIALLLGNLSSLVFDFVARHKMGGTHMNYFIFKQLPVLAPTRFGEEDINILIPRIIELTFTANDLAPWARDLGYRGAVFTYNPERRAVLRAELDAYYARLYGLSRDEVRYILDPSDLMGEDYPSETFRVLKNKELAAYGEYRTQRLVLEAWDRLEQGELE